MSDANMVATTKQLIISIVIVGVMLATANQIGQNFLLTSINARIDSVEARIDSLEKNFEARFARIDEDIRELRRGQEALNLRFSALTARVARIEGFLFDSAEKRAEADRVQSAP